MDLKSRIAQLKEEKLALISDAAKGGQTQVVISESRNIEEIERLQKRLREIEVSLENINKKTCPEPSAILDLEGGEVSGKKRGRNKRDDFVERIKELGIQCRLVKGQIYKVNNRALMGIAYSSERKSGNRWFLGLPSENYEAIVLLCENKSRELEHFILPKDFINAHQDTFSRDENNQIKFNVCLKNGEYQLKIPRGDHVSINEYRDSFENLRAL